MLQYLIVALVVGAALAYSVWVFLPAGVRGSAAVWLAGWAARSGMGEKKAQRLLSTLATAGSCSECAQCKGCATGKPQPPRT
ncbi:MAG TPA: DUF6587 family protein [Ramlibacter sp.]|nr:DUF6587 family protein [Ramlibacter sp.]